MTKRKRTGKSIIKDQRITKKPRLDDTKEITEKAAYSVEEFFYNPNNEIFCYNPVQYKSLDLFGKKLSEEVVNLLISGIKVSDTINNITLDQVTTETESLQRLLQIILECKTVKYLSLKGVRLSEKHVETLSKGLKNNTTLQAIILDKTTINDQKVLKIIDALEYNGSIRNISLKNNIITANGVTLLEKCVEQRDNLSLSTGLQFNVGNVTNLVEENEDNIAILGYNSEQIDDL